MATAMNGRDAATQPTGPAADQDTRARLLATMPLSERRLELAGVSTAVLEGGNGPPVVLLHGLSEFAAVWMRVVPGLVGSYRVIVPELPGHGASQLNGAPLDAGNVLAWLGELIDRTCTAPPVLVGRVLGGAIAARYAIAHGQRLAGLVLVDTLGLAWYRPSPAFALPLLAFALRPTERTQERLMRRCSLDMDGLRERLGEQWEWLLAYQLARTHTPAMQTATRRLTSEFGLRPISAADLARITVPTTLIHGRHDLQVNVRFAQAASARHGWPLHIIEDARDDPGFEQPAAFLAALRTTLPG